jgi:putative peptidoglycan lipid II flippase
VTAPDVESEAQPPEGPPLPPSSGGYGAALVAAGILLSRMLGFVREHFRARFLGAGIAADAFTAAFRLPNLLQNLFGEAALSASFIPVYAGVLAREGEEEAGRVAGAVGAAMALAVSVFVLGGVLLAPVLVDLVNPGFTGAQRDLTVLLARILFPGSGLFVMSAWCLGILNSHRKFFLSYAAPVLWNLAMIAALLYFRARPPEDLSVRLAWASVVGALLQFLVQVPVVLRVAPRLRFAIRAAGDHVRVVGRNFGPAFMGRGVVQLSAYVDQILASFLPVGSVAMLGFAANLYTLPVSLFGMSISAAELPEMARAASGTDSARAELRARLAAGLQRIAFFVVPSSVAFIAFGDVMVRLVFESGRFGRVQTQFTWGILAGSAVGLLAGTLGRLYSSTFYALQDTRTPLRFATARVALTAALGYVFAFPLPRLLGIDLRWGAAGLTASAGLAAWVEFTLLRRSLRRRIDAPSVPARLAATLWIAAAASAAVAYAVKVGLGARGKLLTAAAVLGVYGLCYLASTYLVGVPDARALVSRFGPGRLRSR